jgi:hypothetical protein
MSIHAGKGGMDPRPARCLTGHHRLWLPQTGSSHPDGPLSHGPNRHGAGRPVTLEGSPMSKEKNRGNREAKKPKKEQPKVLATANSNLGKPLDIGKGKKGK